MRSLSLFGPALALFAATACSSITTSPKMEPAPKMERTPEMRRGGSTASRLGVPPGHLPAPGMCRVWLPGRAPGHQPGARSCAKVESVAPAGSWILQRPTKDRKVVLVRVVHERRAGVVVARRVYDARNGALVQGG